MKVIEASILSGDVFIACTAFTLFFIMVFCVYDMNKENHTYMLTEQEVQYTQVNHIPNQAGRR